jgi:hypothetical protein
MHAMKACGIRGCIPNLGSRWSWVVIFMLELGGPQSCFGFGKEINLLPMLRTETLCLGHPAYSLVTILTDLFHLHWISRAMQNDIVWIICTWPWQGVPRADPHQCLLSYLSTPSPRINSCVSFQSCICGIDLNTDNGKFFQWQVLWAS